MKLTFNRMEFLQAARKLCKVAPQTSPAACLTGILLEADADNFEVTMTATNLEVSMSCTLTALAADDYPKMRLTAAEHTAVITNLHTLVKSTAFVVARNDANLTLKCVKLEIAGNTARTVGTDGSRLMTCKKSLEDSNAPLTLLIPSDCFSLLASMVEDTEKLTLESSKNFATFSGEAMTFTTRLGTGSYVDVDSVLSGIQGCYEAFVDAKELHTALDTLEAAASASDQLQMVFALAGISLFCDGQQAVSRSRAIAQVVTPMPPEGFYYPLKTFCQGIAAMNGGLLKLTASANGFLLVSNEEQTLMQSPMRKREKAGKAPSKPKAEKKTTKKAAKKAA